MKRIFVLVHILAVALSFVGAIVLVPKSHGYSGASFYVDPPLTMRFTNTTHPGDTFQVRLKFGNISNLAGFEFKLAWDNSVIEFVSLHDWIPFPGTPFIATNETTPERMYFVVCSMAGSVNLVDFTLRLITFRILECPDPTSADPVKTNITIYDDILGNPYLVGVTPEDSGGGDLIDHETHSGRFECWNVRDITLDCALSHSDRRVYGQNQICWVIATIINQCATSENVICDAFVNGSFLEGWSGNIGANEGQVIPFIIRMTDWAVGWHTIDFLVGAVCNETNLYNNQDSIEIRVIKNPDLTEDSLVNVLDLIRLANSLSTVPGDPNWNAYADVNNDLKINVLDLVLVAVCLGT